MKFDEEITREDCIENIIDFIKNDVLGQVANLHSKIADTKVDAIKGSLCLELAKIHSQAVDYQKNGELPNTLRIAEIRKEHSYDADFLRKKKGRGRRNENKVKSEGILGKLHRMMTTEIK